ncbi:MAG: methyltransferase domain-containing protein [Planctomycetes bacterium]|nr:methyltransferase domain-containing protein [Planctomycetota bacterium]
MTKTWSREEILQLGSSYQPACVLAAAADLDLFGRIGRRAVTPEEAAGLLDAAPRGTRILLDALAALELLEKRSGEYRVPPAVLDLLGTREPGSILAMSQHHANCMRRWSQLARAVKTGQPAERSPSIRGEQADQESFIEAMDNISAPRAAEVLGALPLGDCRCFLDVGGASGTWTIAYLRSAGEGRALLFDLPLVIPLADRRLRAAGLRDRVTLVAGDFLQDPQPEGADLAWVSAIVHQNSRAENRSLFARISAALQPGGRIAVRDIVMDPERTRPMRGALFAVNMLVGTDGGGTFTFDELREDLESAGFTDVVQIREDEWMDSVLLAQKSR